MCIVPHVKLKSVFTFQPIKRLLSTTVESVKPAATFWIFLLRTKNGQLCCLVVMEHIALQERRVATRKKKSDLHFWRSFSANGNQAHPNLFQKRTDRVQIWNKRMRFLLADHLGHMFNFQIILSNFNLQSTSQIFQLTQNHHDLLSLQRRNQVDSWFWTRLCYYCSKRSRTKSNNQLTRKNPIAAWHLLLSQGQEFLDNHLSRVPITPNQQGTFEMRDEVLSSVGAQDLDTSSCQVSYLEDIEFNWENSELDAVFRPGIDTPFSSKTFDDLPMGGSFENPIVLDEEQSKENSPPPSTRESVRPTEPPRFQRIRLFGTRTEIVREYVYRTLFQ